jgi:hypothetical protein
VRIEHHPRQPDRDPGGEAEHDTDEAKRRPRGQQHQEQGHRIDGGGEHRVTAQAREIQLAHADAPAKKGQLGEGHDADRRPQQQQPARCHPP